MKTKFTLLIALCLFIPYFVQAQLSSENRIEFDLKEENSNYEVMPFGKNGVLVFSQDIKDRTAQIERYDTSLKSVDKEMITLPKGYFLNQYAKTDNDLNMLFTDRKSHYIFYRVDADDLKIQKTTGILPKKSYIDKMDVSGDFAYLSGRVKKGALLIKINISAGKSTVVPLSVTGYSLNEMTVKDIQVIEETKETMVGVSAVTKHSNDFVILKFDEKGNKVNEYNLSKSTEKKISSATASSLGGDDYIFTGTYSTKFFGDSEGMYICRTDGDNIDFIKLYNFLDFQEFLSYLSEKKQEKIERKEERKEKKGDEYAINYLVVSHPIIKMGDNYLLIGEAYYPTYRQVSHTTYVNGKSTTTYSTVFDGYQYTHATVAAFDNEGEKLWDRTFEMWPFYKPYVPQKFISVNYDEDAISLLFASRASIRSISFDYEAEIIHDNTTDLIETGSDEDKVRASYANLQYWFDSYFLAFGNQMIKNSEESFGNKKRKVYFINKISYEL